MQTIDDIIRLRDEAIQKLLAEKASLEADLERLTARLAEIGEQLARLGHHVERADAAIPADGETFSLESFLALLAPPIREPARQLHEAVLGLQGVSARFRKWRIAYFERDRFALTEPRKTQLAVRIMAGADLDDPKGWSRDREGRASGRERIFYVKQVGDVEYAMHLIGQAYRVVGGKGE